MANQTDSRAKQVHGGNPQSLVDQIVRSRIYSNIYWKEKLAGANDIVDRAVELKYIGGTYGGNLLKLLQIQPEKKIVYTFIENSHYRALGLFYLRLVGTPEEVYTVCEKFLIDPRSVIIRQHGGEFEKSHMDEYVDRLIRDEIMFDIVLPRLPKRDVLEEQGKISEKVSVLEQELERILEEEENGGEKVESRERSREKEKKSKHESSDTEDEEERKRRRKEKKEKKKLKKLLKKAKKEKREKELQNNAANSD